MQDYNTIVGIIQMRMNECSYRVIQDRYRIGSGTVTRVLNRFKACGLTLDDLKQKDPRDVEKLFYPEELRQRKNIPMPDFQLYYDKIHARGSRMNLAYCWIEYKEQNPYGYEQSQFYELYKRFVAEHYGKENVKMVVNRMPGEKLYIDWVGDKPLLLADPDTGELKAVHIFTTTLGVSSLIYAEIFLDEKLPSFIAGTVNALEFYEGVPKYLVPDNLKTAITKHSKDELILQTSYKDLEEFYSTIVLPPPPLKPKGKASVEGHVKYLETHLVEKLKEKVFTSLQELNAETKKIVATLNSRHFQGKSYSRREAYEKYDKPCLNPLPGGRFAVCDYKNVSSIPDNYHIEYDGHYYSVLYSYCGKPAILKASLTEIRICDQYNRLICKHKRAYQKFPLYITEDDHMPASHLYYKEINSKNGSYYRRWASVFGPNMSEFIDRVLKAADHEEQAYNSCAGILHYCKELPHGIVEETARRCIEMNSCKYTTFKRLINRTDHDSKPVQNRLEALPDHENIRGKDFYK